MPGTRSGRLIVTSYPTAPILNRMECVTLRAVVVIQEIITPGHLAGLTRTLIFFADWVRLANRRSQVVTRNFLTPDQDGERHDQNQRTENGQVVPKRPAGKASADQVV